MRVLVRERGARFTVLRAPHATPHTKLANPDGMVHNNDEAPTAPSRKGS